MDVDVREQAHTRVVFTEYPAPSAGLRQITCGANNALWFTLGLNLIGEMKLDGSTGQYATPSLDTQPAGIVSGPDGALWFTESLAGSIGRITTGGAITEYALPAPNLSPQAITVGPDGNLWFTCIPDPVSSGAPGQIGKITPYGQITLYVLPSPNSLPTGIAIGPKNTDTIWFVESNNRIGKINTSGTIQEFDLPVPSAPVAVALGPDHAMWFTENAACSIGRIGSDGAIAHYRIPSNSPPYGITLGPDHAMWFVAGQGTLGRINPGGQIAEFPFPSPDSAPQSITTGPDGALWFTEGAAEVNKIARAELKHHP